MNQKHKITIKKRFFISYIFASITTIPFYCADQRPLANETHLFYLLFIKINIFYDEIKFNSYTLQSKNLVLHQSQ